MAKRPAEFFSDWHYETHLEGLAREIQGCKLRIKELDALPDDAPGIEVQREGAKNSLKAAQAELDHYTGGTKTASKRPKAEKAQTR